ncbi:alpha-L-fucosidase [Knoellia koreensis]|uniref:alpha-L-fucosidase n=1 Tax=Knoellia koreensis TaxID=2730921 RepID=UPI001982220C
MISLVIGSIIGGLLASGAAVAAPAAPNAAAAPSGRDALVPRPTSWTAATGSVTLGASSRILVDPTSRDLMLRPAGKAEFPGPVKQDTQTLAKQTQVELRELTGLPLQMTGQVKDAQRGDLVLRLVDDKALGAEGYRLDTRGPITIEAASTHGLFYGTRTLVQLLGASADKRTVPRAQSTDVPAQAVRMVQLESGRKYWEMGYLENLIRRMGQLKLNTLFLHLAESEGFRLYSDKFPGLAEPDSSYSRADIERLKALAATQHVQIMAGLEMPGHATRMNETFDIGMGSGAKPCAQQYTHSHLTPNWITDFTRPEAVAKTKEIVAEFSSWFDAPLFSLGADELPGQLANCPKVKDFVAADPEVDTMGDAVVRYLNELDDVVKKTGARSAIYNGVEHMSTPKQDLDSSVVMLTWEGTGAQPAIPGYDEIAIGPFYLTPNNYHNLYPDSAWMYDEWEPSTAKDMLGSGMPHWADYNFWSEDQYWENLSNLPRAVIADRSWNASPTPDTLADFEARYAALPLPRGYVTKATPPRVDDGKPSHRWTFEPAAYPKGWTWAGSPGNTLFVDDVAGKLDGSTYIINNPEPVKDGVVGGSFRFDNGGDGVGFGGVDVAEPWSVSTWVKLSDTSGEQVLLSSKDGALKLRQAGTGKVGFSKTGVGDFSFDVTLPGDRWVNVMWTARKGETTLYVDGQRVGRVAASIALPLRSIGVKGTTLKGNLDELTTWDEQLGEAAVKSYVGGFEQPAWKYEPTVASLNSHEVPAWFNNDKFGIFIHWGAYSVPAWGPRGSYAEWYWNYMQSWGTPTNAYHKETYGQDFNYDQFIGQWKAEKFNPQEWVDLFNEAGAKYFVLTSKHHEGVSLFDSKVSGRDTVDLGPGRDLAGDLFKAAKADGKLKAGFYYSLYEWFNPNYTGRPYTNPYTGAQVPYTGIGPVNSYVDDYMLPQMRELIDQYDPDILWCDGQWDKPASYWKTAGVIADYYNKARDRERDVVVANRCKIQTGNLDSEELDFQTPEYTVKPDITTDKWESSRGIAHSYGYNANEPIEDYQTTDQLVDSFVDIVSKNGNLLLDIGPKADGTVPELMAQRLREMGQWLKVNGEAVYGTTYWNRAEEPASSVPVRYTVKNGAFYATALDWPGATLTLGADVPVADNSTISLLGSDGKALAWKRDANGRVVVTMPAAGADATTSKNAFTFKVTTPGVSTQLRTTLTGASELAPGSSGILQAAIRNVGGTSSAPATIQVAGPSGWTVSPQSADVPALAPGETYTVPVQVTVPEGATGSGTVTVRTTSAGVTTTASATIAVQLPNLSRGKSATQSSLAWGGVPERAVDGNRDGNFNGNSVTHTAEPSNQAWWQVDLGAVAATDRVELWNRTDCCSDRLSNYWVMASQQPFPSGSLETVRTSPAVTAVRVAATAGRPSAVKLPDGTKARYVRIQLESATNPLSLAEVEVRGTPITP